MRIHGAPERGKANLAAGRERARVAAAAYRGQQLRPPEPGTLLRTLRVTDHIAGISYVMTIHQGRRRNGIEPRIFGRYMVRAVCCGYDYFFRVLRRRWALRWLVEG